MIQKNLIIISGTEPRIPCSEVICKNNSSMTHLSVGGGVMNACVGDVVCDDVDGVSGGLV